MRYRALAVVVLVSLWSACSGGGDDGVEPGNNPPTIAFIFSKIGVVKNTATTLSVNVNDLDGDPLIVTWASTRGAITPLNAERTSVRWNPPDAVGTDTITVSVSDGTASRTLNEVIEVGWPFSGSIAPLVFRKDRSPYIVTVTGNPPVLFVDGAATVIEAGTEILLETPGAEITVTDSLVAVGTPTEPIAIRPNVRHQTCSDDRGWWAGIRVANYLEEGYLEMNYGYVGYANWGVRLRDSGSATIRNSAILCSGQDGILHESSGSLVLEDTRVSSGLVDGVEFNSLTLLPESVLIRNCEIAFNGGVGIVFGLPARNTELPITVEYTNLESNALHAITLTDSVLPTLHYNRFVSNGVGQGLISILVYSCDPAACAGVLNLDATCNYWGAALPNSSYIEQTVRDAADDATRGTRVVATPWSNEDPLVGSSSCVVP